MSEKFIPSQAKKQYIQKTKNGSFKTSKRLSGWFEPVLELKVGE